MLRHVPKVWRCSSPLAFPFHLSHLQKQPCSNSICELSRLFPDPYEQRWHLSAFVRFKHDIAIYHQKKGSSGILGIPNSLGLPVRNRSVRMALCMPTSETLQRVNGRSQYFQFGYAAVGICLSLSISNTAYAEAPMEKGKDGSFNGPPTNISSHGRELFTDYSVIGIPGDGRCLFRSIAHGICVRAGKPVPDETLQREMADKIREMVADEYVARREETEWFIEGDFDAYVSNIRSPRAWGGEPELFMASRILEVPITVYMFDEDAGGLMTIAEYGQDYGKENPVRLLYHGHGHYDALQIPGKNIAR